MICLLVHDRRPKSPALGTSEVGSGVPREGSLESGVPAPEEVNGSTYFYSTLSVLYRLLAKGPRIVWLSLFSVLI